MARRKAQEPPEPPFPEFDEEVIVSWPPTHLFEYVRSMDEVDRIVAASKRTGQSREALKSMCALMQSEAEDGIHCVLADPHGVVGCLEYELMASLVYRTRRDIVHSQNALAQFAERDLIKIIGSQSPHFCSAYVGFAYSISGRTAEYPPLSVLPFRGCPFHPGCTKSFVPFVAALASAEQLKAVQVPREDRKMVDPDATPDERMKAALKRVKRLGYKY